MQLLIKYYEYKIYPWLNNEYINYSNLNIETSSEILRLRLRRILRMTGRGKLVTLSCRLAPPRGEQTSIWSGIIVYDYIVNFL